MSRLPCVVFVAVLLGACSTTVPVVAVRPGLIMRGTATASLSGGSFKVTDGTTSCAGMYDAWDTGETITTTMLCNNGLTGSAIVIRNASRQSGTGKIKFSDGTEADLMFGKPAEGL